MSLPLEIDPLFALLVGALGASLIGLFGAWVQSRREHKRWLLQKRYDAYEAYLSQIDKHALDSRGNAGPKTLKEMKVAIHPVSEAVTAISLLGPEYLIYNASKLRDVFADFLAAGKEPPEFKDTRSSFIVAARRATLVSPWWRRLAHRFRRRLN
jgi:hypothetical protein